MKASRETGRPIVMAGALRNECPSSTDAVSASSLTTTLIATLFIHVH